MNTSFTADYDFRPIITKVKILHKLAASKDDALTNIKLLLASEFRNLSVDFQITMSQTIFDAAELPYLAAKSRPWSDITNEVQTPYSLIILPADGWKLNV